MVGNLRRRSMLEEPSSSSSEWDFEWDYTKGKIENFLPSSVSSAENVFSEMRDSGEYIETTTDAWWRVDFPTQNAKSESGILEVDATIISLPQKSGLRLIISNGQGNKACQMYVDGSTAPYYRITYNKQSALEYVTQSYLKNRAVFRIECNIYGDAIPNECWNRLLVDGEQVWRTGYPSQQYASANRIFVQNGKAILHAVRYKLNCF